MMNTEFWRPSGTWKEKGISVNVLLEAIEAALLSAYKRNFDHSKRPGPYRP